MNMMPVYTFSDSSSGSQIAANGETLTAEQAQDNPVGITEKYIYIIRNYINDKVYIGQSIDPAARFYGHITNSATRSTRSAIDGAIKKYGAENFYYEILENKTPDYNEREKYWIAFYNSIAPTGYNILPGGEEPPVLRGTLNNHSTLTEDDIISIRRVLLNPAVTMKEIASAYGVSYRTISHINSGKTYYDKSVDYPIRRFQCSGDKENMLSSNTVTAILYDLMFCDDSMRQISIRYHVQGSQVQEVNAGSVPQYRRPGVEYPVREGCRATKDQVDRIKRKLVDGVMSKHQIAEEEGVSYATVSAINSGRNWFDPDAVYPLKKHEGICYEDESVLETIRMRLKRGDDPKRIVKEMHLPNVSLVYDINIGKSHRSENYTYPIRTFPNKYSEDIIRKVLLEIRDTKKSLKKIGEEYGMHKSTVVQLKNGAYQKYRLPEFTYPLR